MLSVSRLKTCSSWSWRLLALVVWLVPGCNAVAPSGGSGASVIEAPGLTPEAPPLTPETPDAVNPDLPDEVPPVVGAGNTDTAGAGLFVPVARAGRTQVITDEDGDGNETVTLDGRASVDADGQLIRFEWTMNGQTLGEEAVISTSLPVGIHRILLTVTDDDGLTGQALITAVVQMPIEVIPAENSRILDPQVEEVLAVTERSMTLSVTEDADPLQAGQMLAARGPDGRSVLREVISVQTSELGLAVVQTRDVDVTEVFQEISGPFSGPLTLHAPGTQVLGLLPADSDQSPPPSSGSDPGADPLIHATLVNDEDLRVDVTLDAGIDAMLSGELPSGFPVQFNGTRIRFDGSLTTDLTFDVTVKKPFSDKAFEVPLGGKFPLGVIPVFVGVDICPTLQLFAGIEASAAGAGEVEFTDEFVLDVFAEALISGDRVVMTTGADTQNVALVRFELPGQTGLRGYIRAELGVTICESPVLTAFISIRPYLDLTGELDFPVLQRIGHQTVCWELLLGLDAKAGIKVVVPIPFVPDIKLFEAQTDAFFDVNTLLVGDCYTFPAGTLPDIFSKVFSPTLNRSLKQGSDPLADATVTLALGAVEALHLQDVETAILTLNELNDVLGQLLGDGDAEVQELRANVDDAVAALQGG